MKLTTFDASISAMHTTSNPMITFGKIGMIRFNVSAMDALKLTTEDKVSIHQDEENPGDWYVSKDKAGFQLRKLTGNGRSIGFGGTKLKQLFCECFSLDDKETHSYKISETPSAKYKLNGETVHLYAIDTNN